MTLNEKRQLLTLLTMYQVEQIDAYLDNIQEAENMKIQGKEKWEGNYTYGFKAQYEHARIIANKLSKEINDELPSSYQW